MRARALAEVNVENIIKGFENKDFARSANINRILICEETGLAMLGLLEIAPETLKGLVQQEGL